MKFFVLSDPHGFYTIMKQALDKAGWDRGPYKGYYFIKESEVNK